MRDHMDTHRTKRTLQERIAEQVESENRPSSQLFNTFVASARTIFHSRPQFTIAIQNLFAKAERDTQMLITGEHLLGVLLLGIIFFMRVSNLTFNTLHLDEAIYVTVGEDVLSGNFQQGASSWMFGSYLYPVAAALVDQLAGETGLRILSAALVTVAAVFVYMIALRLFDKQTALWSLFVFGLTGVSINLGQHAVYDALGVPLLAITLYCAIRAVREQNTRQQQKYLRWTGVIFSLGVLAKYIGILMLPALLGFMFAAHLYYGRRLLAFFTHIRWGSFLFPIVLILGIYGAYYHDDLRAVFTGQFASQPEDRRAIVTEAAGQIGVPILLAVIGLGFGLQKSAARLRNRRPVLFLLLLTFALLLLASVLAIPLYHLVSANIRSLWKHNVYALVFLAPLAGYGLTSLVQFLRSVARERAHERGIRLRALGAALTALTLIWFVLDSFNQNNAFHRSWPNNQRIIEYLREANLTPQTTTLSSGYAIYEYYFDSGVGSRQAWGNVWYTEYGNLVGTEAIRQAIQECAFDIAILDAFYAPELFHNFAVQLNQAGYAIALSELAILADGSEVITNVYVLPDSECRTQSG